jgi:hypothetical protein
VVSLGSVLWFLTYQVSAGLANARSAEQPVQQAHTTHPAHPHTPAGNEPQHQPKGSEVKE